jgi:hypothetical protein
MRRRLAPDIGRATFRGLKPDGPPELLNRPDSRVNLAN